MSIGSILELLVLVAIFYCLLAGLAGAAWSYFGPLGVVILGIIAITIGNRLSGHELVRPTMIGALIALLLMVFVGVPIMEASQDLGSVLLIFLMIAGPVLLGDYIEKHQSG